MRYCIRKRFILFLSFLAINLAILFTSGCATMNKAECTSADWYSIGFEDGAKGKQASRIGSHRKACAKHGIVPDFQLYTRGRDKGLVQWCTPNNGYQQGLKGKRPTGVCPDNLAPAFEEALLNGRVIFTAQKEVRQQEQQLDKLEKQLTDIDTQIKKKERELVSNGVTPEQRRSLLSEIRNMETERDFLLNDIDTLTSNLVDMRNHLARLKAQHLY